MRIRIDKMKCIASGNCRMTAPALFGTDDDGVVELLQPTPPQALYEAARIAAAACPAAVITIDEDG